MMGHNIHLKGVIWKIIPFSSSYLKHCTVLFQSGFKTEETETEAKDAFPILYQKKKKIIISNNRLYRQTSVIY